MGYGYGYSHGGPHWGALIIGILFVVAVVAALAWIIVALRRERPHPPSTPPLTGPTAASEALRILDERFARGEIDAEEYQGRRDLLRRTE
jgi:putative membrane protein